MKYALITGITGQDGSYLAELLLGKGYIVYGTVRRTSQLNTTRIDHMYDYDSDRLILKYADLTDQHCMDNILNLIHKRGDVERLEIYNLGAMSHVGISYELPYYTSQVCALGVLNLLEATVHCPIDLHRIRFYQASTSELYGDTETIPQDENTPFTPNSPYAVAKLYGYHITNSYKTAYDLYACNGILFNHESPRRGHNFVTQKIVKGAVKIKKYLDDTDTSSKLPCIQLGNLDSKRDWGHAKDYVYGMWLMMQQEEPDNYVLATGTQYSIREFATKVFAGLGILLGWKGTGLEEEGYDLDTGTTYIRVNPRYFRPNEVSNLCGNPSKARTALNWTPTYDLDGLVRDMLDAELTRLPAN